MLEIALAGFSKKDLKVYTEYGKLIIEGKKETKETESEYVHKGLAQRSFNRAWQLSDDVKVRDVEFKDGLLTVKLGKIIPEHHARKDYTLNKIQRVLDEPFFYVIIYITPILLWLSN